MKCPCCGREMKDTSYTMPCLWEEDYPEECIRYQCKACNVTYESGDWHIPSELEPTEKQINAVSYIISRLNNAAEIPYPGTKKNYWEFINNNLEKAKKDWREIMAFEELKMGDIVESNNGNSERIAVIDVWPSFDGLHFEGISSNRTLTIDASAKYYTKTGRHIDIGSFLKQIGGEE